MTDFNPTRHYIPYHLHAPDPTPPALPPSTRLTLLRRRLTFSESRPVPEVRRSYLELGSTAEAESGDGRDKDRQKLSRLKEWINRTRKSRRARRSASMEGQEMWETIPEQDESLETLDTSMIDIPGQAGLASHPHPLIGPDGDDPFAHPSAAFSSPSNRYTRPPSPESTVASQQTPDYSITSPTTRREVAAATRSVTLATRVDQPRPAFFGAFGDGDEEERSYQVDSNASFPSFGSFSPTTRLLGYKDTKAPHNTPRSIMTPPAMTHTPPDRLWSSRIDATRPAREGDSHHHKHPHDQQGGALRPRQMNLLPPPTINANPRWDRLKNILQSTTLTTSRPSSMSFSPSPGPLLHDRQVRPLTPPLTPALTESSMARTTTTTSLLSPPSSPFIFQPNWDPNSHSTPIITRYHLSLPDFSCFDSEDEPSQLTNASHVSLSDTEQGTVDDEAGAGLDALGIYDSSESGEDALDRAGGLNLVDVNVVPDGDGEGGIRSSQVDEDEGGEVVGLEKGVTSGDQLKTSTGSNSSSGSSSSNGLRLTSHFPLPPGRHESTTSPTRSEFLPSKYRPELAAGSPGIELAAFSFPFTDYVLPGP